MADKAKKSGKLQLADLEAVGPGTPAGRYFRKFWQPVMRARNLAPGRAKPIEILGEKFTIYRGESGQSCLVSYRCPHRGTPLSLGWVEGDDIFEVEPAIDVFQTRESIRSCSEFLSRSKR